MNLRTLTARMLAPLLEPTAGSSGRRPPVTPANKDIYKLITPQSRLEAVSLSRKLYSTFGPIRAPIHDKATYAVGRAWLPVFLGADTSWGEAATELLINEFYPNCDIRGAADWQTGLWLDSLCIDRDGGHFIYLTEFETGAPAIGRIPVHRIGSRNVSEGIIPDGLYAGLRMVDGVAFNGAGRAVAYHYLADDAKDDRWISARDLIALWEPEWDEQPRGYPSIMHGLLSMQTSLTAREYEEFATMLAGHIGLIEYNESGGPDPSDPRNLMQSATKPNGSVVTEAAQSANGGLWKFFRANSGSKVEVLKSERPGDAWEKFQDRLIREATSSVWPYELSWKASDLVTPAVRLKIGQAMRLVEDRQSLLMPAARRCLVYAVAKLIKLGRITPNDEWWKWGFTMPRDLSIDHGRDARADLDNYNAKVSTLSELVTPKGITVRQHFEQLKRESVIKAEVLGEEKGGALITDIGIGGAQALTNLIAQIGRGEIERNAGVETIVTLFGIDRKTAERMAPKPETP